MNDLKQSLDREAFNRGVSDAMTPLQRAVQMRKEGRSNTEVAQELGIAYGSASNLIAIARKKALLPPTKPMSLQHKIRGELAGFGLPRGFVGDVLEGLSTDQRVWLYKAATSCGCATVAEYLLELVRDAHAEQTQEKQNDR